MALKAQTELLYAYFFLSYLTTSTLCLGYLDAVTLADPWTVIFCLFTLTSYSMVYLLPAFAITMGANRLFGCWKGKDNLSSLNTFTVSVMAISTTSATLIALYADRQIYHLFGFHFNSFVMNLITTPGGIASMGGSDDASVTYGLIGAAFIGIQTTFYFGVGYLQRRLSNEQRLLNR